MKTSHPRRANPAKQGGVMLLEALIALLIFSVGILAIVGMQATAIQDMGEAKYRSDAAFLANQIVADMWSNCHPTRDATYATVPAHRPRSIANWVNTVQARLPGASANPPIITRDAANNAMTVTVSWQQARDNSVTAPAHSYQAVAYINCWTRSRRTMRRHTLHAPSTRLEPGRADGSDRHLAARRADHLPGVRGQRGRAPHHHQRQRRADQRPASALMTLERDLRHAGFGINDFALVGCNMKMYDNMRAPSNVAGLPAGAGGDRVQRGHRPGRHPRHLRRQQRRRPRRSSSATTWTTATEPDVSWCRASGSVPATSWSSASPAPIAR